MRPVVQLGKAGVFAFLLLGGCRAPDGLKVAPGLLGDDAGGFQFFVPKRGTVELVAVEGEQSAEPTTLIAIFSTQPAAILKRDEYGLWCVRREVVEKHT